jgi:murein DD-endopeptidase MepM/ murein hydrolase activator NlpD
VRGYGSGEGGYHLAVDIAGDIGWNVRAAAPGIVGYSGNEVTGYGNMVLLVHPGGWVTMYAHNSTNFVAAGERVPRGGILAEVGSTGISRGPHVHFELMHGGKNCDPAHLFRPGIRHGGGRLSPIERVEWTRATRRPRQVSCDRRRRHPRSRLVIDE